MKYTTTILIIGLLLTIAALIYGDRGTDASNAPVTAPQTAQDGRSAEIWRITAYCKESCCCGAFADGLTASGKPAKGKLIAAPKSIPFHTWIDIPGYGYAEVLDRGGAIKGRRLDLLFPTHQEALNWGVQYREINIKEFK